MVWGAWPYHGALANSVQSSPAAKRSRRQAKLDYPDPLGVHLRSVGQILLGNIQVVQRLAAPRRDSQDAAGHA